MLTDLEFSNLIKDLREIINDSNYHSDEVSEIDEEEGLCFLCIIVVIIIEILTLYDIVFSFHISSRREKHEDSSI